MKTKLGLYHVPARFVARPASFPSESDFVLLRPGPPRRTLESAIHTGYARRLSRLITCRVRNNRAICQSSDPLEGMAITLNQWILLTARASPDAALERTAALRARRRGA